MRHELRQVHALGKSPLITDQGRTYAESAAIIEYLVDTYGAQLKPGADNAHYRAICAALKDIADRAERADRRSFANIWEYFSETTDL